MRAQVLALATADKFNPMRPQTGSKAESWGFALPGARLSVSRDGLRTREATREGLSRDAAGAREDGREGASLSPPKNREGLGTREGTREGISRDSLGSDDELSMSRAGLGSLDLELISRDGLGTREGARSSTGEGARPQTWDFHVALSSTGLVLHQY